MTVQKENIVCPLVCVLQTSFFSFDFSYAAAPQVCWLLLFPNQGKLDVNVEHNPYQA